MSRRPMQRTASSEAIFAKRRGEIPFQIYFEISNIGRNVESSKKRARWMFCFGDEGQEHEVALVHSVMSGKKKTLFNGELINEAQKVSTEWSFAWSHGAHLLRVGINFDEYSLVIDGIPFSSFSRRDPYLAAQLEATKRDSMRSLRSDEQRRFEKLGYDSGGVGRSRTTERKRPSAGSTGSRRSSSKESAPPRRSDSEERRTGDRARSVVTRASSARQLKSPPNPSGPGEQRGKGKARKPSGQSNGGRFDGHSGSGRGASGGKSTTGDILSADPSSLEVNPFNAQVSEADFDPLASRQGTARGVENGTGNQMRGARGGGGNGFVGTGQQDADAVLRLGMQFKSMEVSQQFQQQQQQQQYQSHFDHTAYQQYDDSGFPQQMPQQVYAAPPQPQVAERVVFSRAPQVAPKGFGGPSGDDIFDFSGGYDAHEQHEQHRQHQHQQRRAEVHRMSGQGSVSSDATDGKASLDPWELARGGMVNIDDITDTKHLPSVEVKPFTNDHRPLADLVREAPSKPRVSVMMERPEPAPTHMAVAIVPVQPPRHQQAVHAQGSFHQQQNGNPFARVALTQYGQPAQPILYTKPDDPFHNL